MLKYIPTPRAACLRKLLAAIFLVELGERHPKRAPLAAAICVFSCLLYRFLWPRSPTVQKTRSTKIVTANPGTDSAYGQALREFCMQTLKLLQKVWKAFPVPHRAMLASALIALVVLDGILRNPKRMVPFILIGCVLLVAYYCPLQVVGNVCAQTLTLLKTMLKRLPSPRVSFLRNLLPGVLLLESAERHPERMATVAIALAVVGFICFGLRRSWPHLSKLTVSANRCSSMLPAIGVVLIALGLWSSWEARLFEEAKLQPGEQAILDALTQVPDVMDLPVTRHVSEVFNSDVSSDTPDEFNVLSSSASVIGGSSIIPMVFEEEPSNTFPGIEEHPMQDFGEIAFALACALLTALAAYAIFEIASTVNRKKHTTIAFVKARPSHEFTACSAFRHLVDWFAHVGASAAATAILLAACLLELCSSLCERDWMIDTFGGPCVFPSGGTIEVPISNSSCAPAENASDAIKLGSATKRVLADEVTRKKQKTTTSISQTILPLSVSTRLNMQREKAEIVEVQPESASEARPEKAAKIAEVTTPERASDIRLGMATSSELLSVETASVARTSLLERVKKYVEKKRRVQVGGKSVSWKSSAGNPRSRPSVLKSYGRSLKRSFISGASLPVALFQVAAIGRQLRRR